MLPGWPEDLNNVVDTDKAQLMDTLGTLLNNLIRMVEDIIEEEYGTTIQQLEDATVTA
jgi:hypothetical protein